MKIIKKNSERLIIRRGNIIFGSLFSFGCSLVLLPFTLFLSFPFIKKERDKNYLVFQELLNIKAS